MRDRGIDALVNDCLIGPVLTMGSTFVAYLCAFLAYLYLEFTDPAYNAGGTYTPVVMAFAFLTGLQVCQIFMTPIGSGVDTIFVAAAWDPQVLMQDHPDVCTLSSPSIFTTIECFNCLKTCLASVRFRGMPLIPIA